MKTFLLSLPFLFGATCLLAQDPRLETIETLPEFVQTSDGEIGVYTNWEANENGMIEVYTVNRSENSAKLQHNNGTLYLKMEANNEEENWERCEIYISPTCGTGLGEFTLKPNQWLMQPHWVQSSQPEAPDTPAIENEIQEIKDFMARARLTKPAYDEKMATIAALETRLEVLKSEKWEKRTVRLRIYDESSKAFSNEGTSFVRVNEIEKCKGDAFAIKFASTERLRAILGDPDSFNATETPYGIPLDVKHAAILALAAETHSVEDTTEILTAFTNTETETQYLSLARSVLETKTEK
jgi:hypothetical protein